MTSRAELVMAYLGLEVASARGSRAWATCPLHAWVSSRPTLSVRLSGAEAGLYHCFACKAGGNLPMLVAAVRGVSYEEALEVVDHVAGGEAKRRRRQVFRAAGARPTRRGYRLPPEVVVGEPLGDWPSPASGYLAERGIGAAVVEAFGVGYAVDGRLAGRVVLPIRVGPDAAPAGYSARSFAGEEPRYLTPHAGEGADPGAVFGEHLWPPEGERRVVVVTEGAIDALSVHATAGCPVAALGGSDVDAFRALAVATFGGAVILTDADEPGEAAARRIRGMLGRATRTARARLPRGEDGRAADANELLRRDPGALRMLVEAAAREVAS